MRNTARGVVFLVAEKHNVGGFRFSYDVANTEIGRKAWLFVKLQLGRARKRINAT